MRQLRRTVIAALLLGLAWPATAGDRRAAPSDGAEPPPATEGVLPEEITLPADDEAGQAIVAGIQVMRQRAFAEAERHFRQALDLLERRFGPGHYSTLPIASLLGWALVEQQKYVEGETVLRRVLQGYEKKLGPGPAPPDRRHLEAAVKFGVALWGQKRYAEAELALRRALGLLEQNPAVEERMGEETRLFLGGALTKLQRPDEAEPLLRQALQRAEKAKGPRDVDRLMVLWQLGEALAAGKKYAEAESALRRALSGYDAVPAADRSDVHRRDAHIMTMTATLGGVLLAQGRAAKAQPVLQRRLELVQKHFARTDIETQNAARDLAQSLCDQGRKARAREILQQHGIDPDTGRPAKDAEPASLRAAMVSAEGRHLEVLPDDVVREIIRGVQIYAEGGRELARGFQTNAHSLYSESEGVFRRALQVAERAVGTGHIATALIEVRVGDALIEQRRYADAESHLRRALGIQQALLERQGQKAEATDRLLLVRTWLRLGLALYGQHKPDEIIATFRRGLDLADELGFDDPGTAASRMFLGEVLFHEEVYVQAEDQFRRVVATYAKYREPEDADAYRRAVAGIARSVSARRR